MIKFNIFGKSFSNKKLSGNIYEKIIWTKNSKINGYNIKTTCSKNKTILYNVKFISSVFCLCFILSRIII